MYVLCKNLRYKVIRELDDGAQGTISQILDRQSGQLYAMKEFNHLHKPKQYRAFEVEVHCLHNLKHIDGVLQLCDTWRTYDKGYMVTELCNGSLDPEKYGKLPLDEVRSVAQFMVRTLECVHALGVQHNDVKPANILRHATSTNKEKYRLCDFGLAYENFHVEVGSERMRGTLDYIAPECLTSTLTPSFGKADVWSLGVSLYELATGVVPFFNDSYSETVRRIRRSVPDFSLIEDPTFVDFLQQSLRKDPDERATIEQLKCHPYLCPTSPSAS